MKYSVKRYWQLCDSVEVEALTPDQAIERAHQMPLDESRGGYVMGSLNSDPLADVEPLSDGKQTLNPNIPTAKFRLGKIVTTPNAMSQLTQEEILRGIQRHQAGDWGDLYEHERTANDRAITDGTRIWSVYHTAAGVKFWVITEADLSVTTILMPEDY